MTNRSVPTWTAATKGCGVDIDDAMTLPTTYFAVKEIRGVNTDRVDKLHCTSRENRVQRTEPLTYNTILYRAIVNTFEFAPLVLTDWLVQLSLIHI